MHYMGYFMNSADTLIRSNIKPEHIEISTLTEEVSKAVFVCRHCFGLMDKRTISVDFNRVVLDCRGVSPFSLT